MNTEYLLNILFASSVAEILVCCNLSISFCIVTCFSLNREYCSSSTKCVGTFIPNENANPYIGENNKLEYVEEEKLEVVCNVENVKSVISRLREVHPYEEPAIDIIPLLNEEDF